MFVYIPLPDRVSRSESPTHRVGCSRATARQWSRRSYGPRSVTARDERSRQKSYRGNTFFASICGERCKMQALISATKSLHNQSKVCFGGVFSTGKLVATSRMSFSAIEDGQSSREAPTSALIASVCGGSRRWCIRTARDGLRTRRGRIVCQRCLQACLTRDPNSRSARTVIGPRLLSFTH